MPTALVLALLALAVPQCVTAATGDEQALAERYSPVVRLVAQPEECGPGEPYEPMESMRCSARTPSRCAGHGARPTS